MRSRVRPLFQIDPGWLFIISGLALCVAGVLIPAQRDLCELQGQLEALRERERIGNERLRAHADFIADLDLPPQRPDLPHGAGLPDGSAAPPAPGVTRRLAASQLNIVPAGDVPVVLAASSSANMAEWIESRARSRSSLDAHHSSFAAIHRSGQLTAEPGRAGGQGRGGESRFPDTALSRLASGPKRLWLLGAGVLAVFIGLMLAPPGRRADSAAGQQHQRKLERKETAMHGHELAETMDSVQMDLNREDVWCEILTARDFAREADEDEIHDASMRCAAD